MRERETHSNLNRKRPPRELRGPGRPHSIILTGERDNRIRDRLPSLVVLDPKDELFMLDYDMDRMVSLEE